MNKEEIEKLEEQVIEIWRTGHCARVHLVSALDGGESIDVAKVEQKEGTAILICDSLKNEAVATAILPPSKFSGIVSVVGQLRRMARAIRALDAGEDKLNLMLRAEIMLKTLETIYGSVTPVTYNVTVNYDSGAVLSYIIAKPI